MKTILTGIKNKIAFVRRNVEFADTGFLLLRIAALCTLYSWILFADIDPALAESYKSIVSYFALYCVALYVLLVLFFQRKRVLYALSLLFDLSVVYLLIGFSGGFESNFFIALYFLTALHSFYFGIIFGLGVATVSSILYLFSGNFDFITLHWADFVLRIGFLYLIALPLGFLSDQLRKDKQEIETLNCELLKSLHESNRLQKKLIKAERLSALGKITADVAHEIRNPLTAIGGFAKRLQKRIRPDTREKDYIDLIVSETGRLERILRDVLSFSREARYHLSITPPNAVVEDSLHTFSDTCKEQSITVNTVFDLSLRDILLDRDQITQAINNLLSNAVDAMPGGGVLTVSTQSVLLHDANFIVIEISDTGTGIPAEKLDRLFDPFYSTKEIGHGTGLGLSICKKIMDEHKGFIRVTSESGKGSAFRLYLPYVMADEAFRTQCWEFTKCGVEKMEDSVEKRCPAYPNFGRICWAIAGTFCEGKVQGAVAQKLGDCRKCEFYQRVVDRHDL